MTHLNVSLIKARAKKEKERKRVENEPGCSSKRDF